MGRGVVPSTWYDADNPDELHADLRDNHAKTMALVAKRPALQRHVRDCVTCKEITALLATPPATSRRRMKVVLRPQDFRQMLDLPPGTEILYMYCTPDPNAVHIVLAGEGLPDVAEGAATPVAGAGDTAQERAA